MKSKELPKALYALMKDRNQLDYALLEAAQKVLNKRKQCADVETKTIPVKENDKPFDKRFEYFMNSLSGYQNHLNCSMSYLKSPQVSLQAKRKYKVEVLKPKLADPSYTDKTSGKCHRGRRPDSSSSTSPSSSVPTTTDNIISNSSVGEGNRRQRNGPRTKTAGVSSRTRSKLPRSRSNN